MGVQEGSTAEGQGAGGEGFEFLSGLNEEQAMSLLLNNGGQGKPVVLKFAGRTMDLSSLFNATLEDVRANPRCVSVAAAAAAVVVVVVVAAAAVSALSVLLS